ncbi:ABC transporter substrate-binding protein [Roseateles sp. GG27B]
MSEFSPARAMALLDLYGYVDRDGDGWRDLPGAPGSPVQALELVRSTQPDNQSRQLDELWQKNLAAVGLRVRFKAATWPENLKSVRGGNFMIWGVGSSSDQPDSQSGLQRFYGPASGGQNLSRFKSAEFDRIYDQMQGLSDGPERLALLRQAQLIAVAYMPYKAHVHRMLTDMAQPWLIGYRRPVFWQDWWQYVDIDTSRLPH